MDLVQLLKRIAELSPGPSPNEGFAVPPSEGNLGMSEGAMTFADILRKLQGSGVRPTMPLQAQGPSNSIFELMRMVKEAESAAAQPQQPQQGSTVGDSRDLLRRLLSE